MTEKKEDCGLTVWLMCVDDAKETICMEHVSQILVDTIAAFIAKNIPLQEEIYERCKSDDLAIVCINQEETVVYPLSCYSVAF